MPDHHPNFGTTRLVRTTAARDLLPVTNELFFHVLADQGRGVRLSQPLTRYRVHHASMTDRRTPGVFADYMAGVCADVAARLEQLRDHPPSWTSSDELALLAADHRERIAEHRDDAHRQRERAARDIAQERRSA